MFALPWVAIFLAVPATWLSAIQWLSLGLLILGYGAALANGQLGFQAAIPVALVFLAAYAVRPNRKAHVRYIGHALFIALAIALSMHWLPGFHNPLVIGPERFTSDAVPFTMYLNLDKPLIGFWLLLVLPWIRPRYELRKSLIAGIGGLLIAAVTCLTGAVLLGLVTWAPKWPSVSGLWLLNNLLLVTVTEEALFRGYLQGGLSRLLKQRSYADALALCAAAALFGLAHIAGGWQWMVLGGLAGIGYGLAYRFGGLQAAVLAHFGLNVLHFFLLTYPMLQPAGQS
ncbi:CPBP family intramembrane glutamic endopeptidase [Paraburkholderia lacunae]|uniref:CPBP family intramembrane metalloprotease domain-containing protein n=1 Tax=Paraburkholderia lacunae TaxID=2211104 RepID=A0A370NCL5_9BURK|nr:CPBP family intramembrane glutamic endopeptidase [Paraburkholderia lacunae]RDK03315.1 CPBP family intramembrane metalloprotease domain-containing protein [Paraburkholderia lacunae]